MDYRFRILNYMNNLPRSSFMTIGLYGHEFSFPLQNVLSILIMKASQRKWTHSVKGSNVQVHSLVTVNFPLWVFVFVEGTGSGRKEPEES